MIENSIFLKNMVICDGNDSYNGNIVIMDGVIHSIYTPGANISLSSIETGNNHTTIDGENRLVCIPGMFDMHVHFREPGQTHKETIRTGSMAALAGGITGAACMPNTTPPADSPEIISAMLKSTPEPFNLYPVGCITMGLKGKTLTDFAALKAAGAIALSDDGRPVASKALMKKALELAGEVGIAIISHSEDLDIVKNGIMNKGTVSDELGVGGIDRLSEENSIRREIELSKQTGVPIHIAHISTEGSVEAIREAKWARIPVTCETAPHYFFFTDEMLRSKNANFRMNPPLRTETDRQAIINGLLDGTIDCIATDHAPHTPEEKSDFITAPNGVLGLETSLSALLSIFNKDTRLLDYCSLVRWMCTRPRDILGIPVPKISGGETADIIIFDPFEQWTVEAEKMFSKSRNTPFEGITLTGKVKHVIIGRDIVYSHHLSEDI